MAVGNPKVTRSGHAIPALRNKEWLEQNRHAIQSSNAYVEKYGLPLAKYRLF